MPKKKTSAALAAENYSGNETSQAEAPVVSGLAPAHDSGEDQTDFRPPAVAPKAERVVMALDDRGGIDLSSMRDSTKDKIKAAIRKTPELLAEAGPVIAPKDIPDQAVDYLYRILGSLEVWAASRKYPEDLAKVFEYRQDELSSLRGPTKDILAKYAPSISRFQEEVTLAIVLIGIHTEKVRVLNTELARRVNADTGATARVEAA